ncbi:DUF3768 domain-containing protein [Porticoccus sp. GXU_MW_L64]
MSQSENNNEIAKQNDQFRKRLMIPHFGIPNIKGRHIMTKGIVSLGAIAQIEIAGEVREFDKFTEDNDPYGEHDFGSFVYKGDKIFWKIDYYDVLYQFGSENISDPKQTRRVLTVMLASEY